MATYQGHDGAQQWVHKARAHASTHIAHQHIESSWCALQRRVSAEAKMRLQHTSRNQRRPRQQRRMLYLSHADGQLAIAQPLIDSQFLFGHLRVGHTLGAVHLRARRRQRD